MIYLITVNYYSAELIRTLLNSVRSQVTVNYQVVIVNNSPDDAQIYTLAQPKVQILEAGANRGFGEGCNLGLQWVYERDPTAIAWLINPDTTLTENALAQAVQFWATHPHFSILGTVIYEPDNTLWFAGGAFEPASGKIVAIATLPEPLPDYWETAWVTGCSLLLNLGKFSTCPQFDPAFFLYYEDFDFCRRYMQQGHAIAVTATIQVVHRPSSITSRNRAAKFEHSTYSYLLALERYTVPWVVGYRLSRIVAHALRASLIDREKAIAIIKGVLRYVRVSRLGKFSQR